MGHSRRIREYLATGKCRARALKRKSLGRGALFSSSPPSSSLRARDLLILFRRASWWDLNFDSSWRIFGKNFSRRARIEISFVAQAIFSIWRTETVRGKIFINFEGDFRKIAESEYERVSSRRDAGIESWRLRTSSLYWTWIYRVDEFSVFEYIVKSFIQYFCYRSENPKLLKFL